MESQPKKPIHRIVLPAAGCFLYDEGSRSRKVLTDLIKDADIAALQSDAYNVYKYLDGEISEVKPIHYLKNAWTPVMAYRNNGRYSIDNSIAERSIRKLTIEPKNKMAFGNHQGTETSTVYHTFMETCKIGALSFYKFLKNYLTAFMEGRTDFENLPPTILGKIN